MPLPPLATLQPPFDSILPPPVLVPSPDAHALVRPRAPPPTPTSPLSLGARTRRPCLQYDPMILLWLWSPSSSPVLEPDGPTPVRPRGPPHAPISLFRSWHPTRRPLPPARSHCSPSRFQRSHTLHGSDQMIFFLVIWTFNRACPIGLGSSLDLIFLKYFGLNSVRNLKFFIRLRSTGAWHGSLGPILALTKKKKKAETRSKRSIAPRTEGWNTGFVRSHPNLF